MTRSALDERGAWMLPTYIVTPGGLDGPFASLEGDEGRHAARAARARTGQLIRLIDGEGTEAAARVVSADDRVELEIVERRTRSRAEGVELVVGQALLKGRDFDSAARRLAELGTARIVPLLTERVVPRLDPTTTARRVERWRAVTVAATKQSRGVFVTDVTEPVTLDEFIVRHEADARLVAWEEGGVDLREALQGVRDPGTLACIVGPEGGLAAVEVDRLVAAGYVAVGLGDRILRGDWAAAAVATLISHHVGGLLP
ncbi:MAG: RsmE family RNA methyltransferase [Candidatus Eisenbacteria bacterium]|nr:RsmE family RNA methyltransferase [Candidatus Eisenbacteria bacterium]